MPRPPRIAFLGSGNANGAAACRALLDAGVRIPVALLAGGPGASDTGGSVEGVQRYPCLGRNPDVGGHPPDSVAAGGRAAGERTGGEHAADERPGSVLGGGVEVAGEASPDSVAEGGRDTGASTERRFLARSLVDVEVRGPHERSGSQRAAAADAHPGLAARLRAEGCELLAARPAGGGRFPELSVDALLPRLEALELDAVVVACFPYRVPAVLHEAPARPVYNIHPSLLPAFPGRDPVGAQLAAGVRSFGVSVHRVTAVIDAGPVLVQGRLAPEGALLAPGRAGSRAGGSGRHSIPVSDRTGRPGIRYVSTRSQRAPSAPAESAGSKAPCPPPSPAAAEARDGLSRRLFALGGELLAAMLRDGRSD